MHNEMRQKLRVGWRWCWKRVPLDKESRIAEKVFAVGGAVLIKSHAEVNYIVSIERYEAKLQKYIMNMQGVHYLSIKK